MSENLEVGMEAPVSFQEAGGSLRFFKAWDGDPIRCDARMCDHPQGIIYPTMPYAVYRCGDGDCEGHTTHASCAVQILMHMVLTKRALEQLSDIVENTMSGTVATFTAAPTEEEAEYAARVMRMQADNAAFLAADTEGKCKCGKPKLLFGMCDECFQASVRTPSQD